MYNQQPQIVLTPVVKILLIINVVMYVLTTFIVPTFGPLLYLYFPSSDNFQPYQLLTHMFMHDPHGFGHIAFNMFGLVSFGTMVEKVWREQRFLFFYLFCGFGATALDLSIKYWQISNDTLPIEIANQMSSLGASGCIYGVMVAAAMIAPNIRMGVMLLPFSLPAKYFVPIIVAIDLVLGISNQHTGIGHFAHVGGAIAGFLLSFYWLKGIR
jgi:membrane associated rhomboid family serine protease